VAAVASPEEVPIVTAVRLPTSVPQTGHEALASGIADRQDLHRMTAPANATVSPEPLFQQTAS